MKNIFYFLFSLFFLLLFSGSYYLNQKNYKNISEKLDNVQNIISSLQEKNLPLAEDVVIQTGVMQNGNIQTGDVFDKVLFMQMQEQISGLQNEIFKLQQKDENEIESLNLSNESTIKTDDIINKNLERNVGYITKAYSKSGKNYIEIDYIQYGPTTPSGAPSIINNNTKTRLFELDLNSIFKIYKYVKGDGFKLFSISLKEFQIRANSNFETINTDLYNPIYAGGGKTSLVIIKNDKDKIYSIEEEFRP